MTERTRPASEPVRAAARQVQGIVELLDILWEQARSQTPPPYIPASQLRVMCIVDREDGIRMRDLTQLLGAAPPSVSRLIDRLQALGFVERRACPDSRREVLLSITPAGHNQLARIRELRDQLLHQAIAAVPSPQRTALTEGLTSLQHALLSQPALHLAQEGATPADRHRETAA
ncbi:MarR family winged helix-turn-helix transcriptional regulator [Streptomyces sp. NBC_00358]|jgi:Transcriptional regulators|uniref:MarR family winged helix-turn-helix transcriptional regulator n=1 Tax=Streptomyces sp. NBC_00358 TaxID=2975725 RepID=UPI002E253025